MRKNKADGGNALRSARHGQNLKQTKKMPRGAGKKSHEAPK